MTDQTPGGHEGREPAPRHRTPPAHFWPTGQGRDDPHPLPPQDTQQWRGQTWETSTQPPVSTEETAWLPPVGGSPERPPTPGTGPAPYGERVPYPDPRWYERERGHVPGPARSAAGGDLRSPTGPTPGPGTPPDGGAPGYADPPGHGAPGYSAPGYSAPGHAGLGRVDGVDARGEGFGDAGGPTAWPGPGTPGTAGAHSAPAPFAAPAAPGGPPSHGAPGASTDAPPHWGRSFQGQPADPDPGPGTGSVEAPAHPMAHRPAPGADAHAAPAPPVPGAPDTEGAPGYGPATLAGNSRVTDARRARAEGRSPIIEPGARPAALTALLALLLAAAAGAGPYALLLPLLVLQGLTAAGWFRLNGMWPAREGIALGVLGAIAADVAVLAADRSPAAVLGAIGVWVPLVLVLRLRSHADPEERMHGLMATVVASALAILAAGHLVAEGRSVVIGGVAVAVAVVARALPLPAPFSAAVAWAAGAVAAGVVGAVFGVGMSGALLGAAAAGCALVGLRVASYDYPSRFVHFTAGVALPLTLAAPAVWALGRAVG
ncbi:hypothetical protein [Streptomyces sp. WMMC905]|uniref:hypothetical protein n=1 Tax=Streptomyces sp. WMMC905 TaxID=3404123 RepID=UPI003B94B59E